MSDRVIELSKELKENLNNEPVLREYLRIKDIFEKDSLLNDLRKNIAIAKEKNDKERYDTLKEMYDNLPLVKNFYQLQDEVVELLQQVNQIISK